MHGFIRPTTEMVDDQRDRFTNADLHLTKAVATTVQSFYPGHPWRVEVSHAQGIIKIQLQPFMGPTHWHVIHISSAKVVSELRTKVMRACGEILERYQVPRARFSLDDFLHVHSLIPQHRRFHGFVPG